MFIAKLDFLSILNSYPNNLACLADELLKENIPYYNRIFLYYIYLEGSFKNLNIMSTVIEK